MSKFARRIPFICPLLLLVGCFGGGHYAPVIERQEPVKSTPNTYIVSRGETLYSIAWRYGLDFRGLAATNEIAPPYTIYPGQKISLDRSPDPSSKTAKSTDKHKPNTRHETQKTVRSSTPKEALKKGDSAWQSQDKTTYPNHWQWPANGEVIRRYSASSSVHKGIDLKGKLGEPVHAANSGKVVYAGSGLVGYGKLLIIKHDEHYLSAYGHNSRLLVNEGEMVKVGQRIAEFGDTGTDKVKLHFEIRRDGKPVNPLDLLPGDRS